MSKQETNLYLHIGLPKTATTFLQSSVFPQFDHLLNLGTPESANWQELDDQRLGGRILSCCMRRSSSIWPEFGDLIFEELLGPKELWLSNRRDVLISDEGVGRAGSRPSLLKAHMAGFRKKAMDWGFDRVSIICVFRRQDHWYASHYAQMSDRNYRASQQDFERQVERLVDPYQQRFQLGMLLDYKSLRDALVSAVGANNVLMLPHELLVEKPRSFMDEISAFVNAGDQHIDLEEGAKSPEGRNVRSQGLNQWGIRPFGQPVRLRPYRMWQSLGLSQSPVVSIPRVRRQKRFKLAQKSSELILQSFSDRNRLVANDIDRCLRRYGYY